MYVNKSHPVQSTVSTTDSSRQATAQQIVTSTDPCINMLRQILKRDVSWYAEHQTDEQKIFIQFSDMILAHQMGEQPGPLSLIIEDTPLSIKVVNTPIGAEYLELSFGNNTGCYSITFNELRARLQIDRTMNAADYGLSVLETSHTLSGHCFRQTDLSGLDLNGAILTKVDLRQSNLAGANLSAADQTGADLIGADLTDATLKGANLKNVNARDGILIRADLTEANLTKAILIACHLDETNLTRACLKGTHLLGARQDRFNLHFF